MQENTWAVPMEFFEAMDTMTAEANAEYDAYVADMATNPHDDRLPTDAEMEAMYLAYMAEGVGA